MTFQSAFGSGDKNLMRSAAYSSDYLVKLCSNRVVLAARLMGAVSASFALVAYNNVTVGTYTDVVVGQVVLIGDTSDITQARRRGRVRKTPTGSILYINEISDQFADQAYVWVIDTFDAQYKLSRPDASGAELIDYDTAYEGMQPAVTGLRTVYANYDPAGGNYRIAFSVSAFAKQSGGTISSYAWTFKAGTYTVISGSLSAAAVTVDIAPGEQWGKLVVTDNAGVSLTRHFLIQACDNSVNPPDTYINPMTINGDVQRGWTMNLEAFAGVDSVLNQTFAVVFRYNETYGTTPGSLSAGNNIAFCGWLQRESDQVIVDREASVIETATFEFNGVGAALARLNSQLVPFYDSASPSAWGYIKVLTPWRAVGHYLDRYTTISTLCDIAYDNASDTYEFPTITTQGGNALEVIQGIAGMNVSVIEFAPDGRIQFVKDVTYQNSTERGNDPVIMAFEDQDCLAVTRTIEPSKSYGLTDTDGAYYNTATGQAVGFTARAPGVAREEAQGSDNLPAQILTAGSGDVPPLAELLQRAANRFEYVNNNEYLDVDFPDGYHWLIPSRQQLFTFTLASLTASGVNRISYTAGSYWICEQATIARGENGTTTIRAHFHIVQRIGQGAINTTLVPPGTEPFLLPDYGLPAFGFEDPIVSDAGGLTPPPDAPNPTVADATGQFMVVKNNSAAWIERNFINMTTPPSAFVTPSDLGSYAISQVLLDPFTDNTSPGCYLLGYDSTNTLSAVWYTANVLTAPPIWVMGTPISGRYQTMRATSTPGAIELYGFSTVGSTTYTITFDSGGYPYSYYWWDGECPQAPPGVVYGTGGNPNGYMDSGTSDISIGVVVEMDLLFDSTITDFGADSIKYHTVGGYGLNVRVLDAERNELLAWSAPLAASDNVWYTDTHGATSIPNARYVLFEMGANWANGCASHLPLHAGMDNAFVTILNGASGTSDVRTSFDYGATFGTPNIVGSMSLPNGGLDTARSSQVSYATCDAKVRKASTVGGPYSDHGTFTGASPVCVVVPYYRRNSTTTKQTTATDPDYIVALNTADSDGGTLYFVDGATATKHNITPESGATFTNANCITAYYGTYLAVFGTKAGTQLLWVSFDAGTTWTRITALITPGFIRGRRGDDSALRGRGQLYIAHNAELYFSSRFGRAGLFIRNQPVANANGFDIWG